MKMSKILNYSVSYHWSDNTQERAFICAEDPRQCGDLYPPEYLLEALEKYAKELEESENV
jgi:hypothetical protein